MNKQPLNVSAFVYPPDAGKTNEIVCGTELVAIPIYKTVADATAARFTSVILSRPVPSALRFPLCPDLACLQGGGVSSALRFFS